MQGLEEDEPVVLVESTRRMTIRHIFSRVLSFLCNVGILSLCCIYAAVSPKTLDDVSLLATTLGCLILWNFQLYQSNTNPITTSLSFNAVSELFMTVFSVISILVAMSQNQKVSELFVVIGSVHAMLWIVHFIVPIELSFSLNIRHHYYLWLIMLVFRTFASVFSNATIIWLTSDEPARNVMLVIGIALLHNLNQLAHQYSPRFASKVPITEFRFFPQTSQRVHYLSFAKLITLIVLWQFAAVQPTSPIPLAMKIFIPLPALFSVVEIAMLASRWFINPELKKITQQDQSPQEAV